MASCNGDCTNYSANNAKWFKVDAGGYDPSTKLWAADQLRASWLFYFLSSGKSSHGTIPDNNTWTSTIPAQLVAGQYVSGVQLREHMLFLLIFLPQLVRNEMCVSSVLRSHFPSLTVYSIQYCSPLSNAAVLSQLRVSHQH